MTGPAIYLAGPEVFHREAFELGKRKKTLCIEYGFIGLFPFDNEIGSDEADASMAIFSANEAMIRRADAAIFNLTPFRGPSADVGTVFELGMFIALGKPAFGYTQGDGALIDRLRISPGLTLDTETGLWRDPDGMAAEDFGNVDNLMIDASLAKQGRKVRRALSATPDPFVALDGFRACLEEAKAYFAKAKGAAARAA